MRIPNEITSLIKFVYIKLLICVMPFQLTLTQRRDDLIIVLQRVENPREVESAGIVKPESGTRLYWRY
jgi:hypothetical protein